jgi:hypothetical protein
VVRVPSRGLARPGGVARLFFWTFCRGWEPHRVRPLLYSSLFSLVMALQPDFSAISSGFRELGDQFRRCENLPAVDGGARLLQALEGLREDVQGMRHGFVEVRQRLDRIEARTLAR